MRAEIERLAVSASIHTLVTFRTSDCCFNNRVIIHQLALKNFVGFSFSMLENHKSSCVCFLWTFVLFDLPIFYSLEARCEGVSVYFTVFSSLSTLLKRFRVLCPCVCRNVCCLPPPNPNSKPGLNPTEWGKMVIQSNRLLKQCWIKHPRLAHLHWPCKKKNYRSSVVVQPTFPSCVLFLCLAVSKFLSTETCQLSRPSSNLTFARTQSSPTLALQFDHPPIWPYDGTPRNLIWPSKRNPETCIPRFGKPLPRGRKTSCNWTRIC